MLLSKFDLSTKTLVYGYGNAVHTGSSLFWKRVPYYCYLLATSAWCRKELDNPGTVPREGYTRRSTAYICFSECRREKDTSERCVEWTTDDVQALFWDPPRQPNIISYIIILHRRNEQKMKKMHTLVPGAVYTLHSPYQGTWHMCVRIMIIKLIIV